MSANKGGATGSTLQDLNVTGDSANAMPTQVYDNERPFRLPGQAGLLFDQIMANNLKAGQGKEEGDDGGLISGAPSGSGPADPLHWAQMGAGQYAPKHSARDVAKSALMGGGGKGGST